jgi:hypothetical protein
MAQKPGVGRKPKDNPLKVTNFRLSNQDLKLIDKKGIGKNSSERLRYILEHCKNPKLNISKRRKSYKTKRFFDFAEALEFFNQLNAKWNTKDKLPFLCSTLLRNDLLQEIEAAYLWKIRSISNFLKLEQLGWRLNESNFKWVQSSIVGCSLQLTKEGTELTFSVTEENDDFISQNSNESIPEELSSKEEDLFSQLYEEIQTLIFDTDFIQDERLTDYKKEYPGGDFYRSVEYNNVVIIEMDYHRSKNAATLHYIKELDE